MIRIGLVTGMRAEEECLAGALADMPPTQTPLTFCAGANAERAYHGARSLVERGAGALLSIGIAGGLDAALRPGDVVLPDLIVGPDGTQGPVSALWHAAVVQEIPGPAIGSLYASADAACTVAAKATLRAASGALAIDMESGAVAAAAAEAKVPFLALRIVADPADRAVPLTALHGIGPDGNQRPFAVLARLALRPVDLPALVRLARDSKVALRELRRVASLGRALFLPPLL